MLIENRMKLLNPHRTNKQNLHKIHFSIQIENWISLSLVKIASHRIRSVAVLIHLFFYCFCCFDERDTHTKYEEVVRMPWHYRPD